jgi:hypothetical protein
MKWLMIDYSRVLRSGRRRDANFVGKITNDLERKLNSVKLKLRLFLIHNKKIMS